MDFFIGRILGNELPPRDSIGSKIKGLQYILDHEPLLERCSKIWLINQVFDLGLKQEYVNILKEYQQEFIEIPFPKDSYLKQVNHSDKVKVAININKARNFLFGLKKYDFILPLDGDCFFDLESWKETISFIEEDQFVNDTKYYCIPMYRVDCQEEDFKKTGIIAEPQLCLRKDVRERFNEDFYFGKEDKIEFIRKIGTKYHSCEEYYFTNNRIRKGGKIYHACLGDFSSDQIAHVRYNARKESLDLFVRKIDEELKK